MCTILVLRHARDDFPLVVAANRDELYARAATGPRVLAERPRLVGGSDLARGGSWLGVTEVGMLAAVTNQRGHFPPDPSRRSRGELVVGALAHESVASARAWLATVDGRDYNPFNLLYGDAEHLEVAYARPGQRGLTFVPVPRGLHVLPNDELDATSCPKVARARERMARWAATEWDALRGELGVLLADHSVPEPSEIEAVGSGLPLPPEQRRQLDAMCIHTPIYGTRSAWIIALRPGAVAHCLFADGPPCQAAFDPVSLLASAP
jgi:uncharacterized protein with NRDE domain